MRPHIALQFFQWIMLIYSNKKYCIFIHSLLWTILVQKWRKKQKKMDSSKWFLLLVVVALMVEIIDAPILAPPPTPATPDVCIFSFVSSLWEMSNCCMLFIIYFLFVSYNCCMFSLSPKLDLRLELSSRLCDCGCFIVCFIQISGKSITAAITSWRNTYISFSRTKCYMSSLSLDLFKYISNCIWTQLLFFYIKIVKKLLTSFVQTYKFEVSFFT